MEFLEPANNNRVTENVILPFILDNSAIKGSFVRINDQLHKILSGHKYPERTSQLLGEMLVLIAMIGSLLKIKGLITIQAQGDGPMGFITVDYNAEGHLRGYAHMNDAEKMQKISAKSRKDQDITELFGKGAVIITIEEPGEKPYQAISPLEGKSLSACIAGYFRQSNQVDIIVESVAVRDDGRWRSGGIILQRIPDENEWHEETIEKKQANWDEAALLAETVSDDELTDKKLAIKEVLYRLFHEGGVRVFPTKNLEARCRCSREKMISAINSISEEEIEEMKIDNKISMKCHFCSNEEIFTDADLI